MKAHTKTPKEFLYLETGSIPLKWVISQRRLNYLKHILNRDSDELIKKVYLAQKEKPTRGDFVKLVENDLKELGISYEQAISTEMTKQKLKIIARNAAFIQLLQQQSSHKKVKHIPYKTLEIQPYLKSALFTQKDVKILTALRSHCLKGIKMNFQKMHKLSISCPLKCSTEEAQVEDTQEHLITCKKLNGESETNISNMYSVNLLEQAQVAKIIGKQLRKREQILEDQEDSLHSLPGASFLDPSIQLQQQKGAASSCISD